MCASRLRGPCPVVYSCGVYGRRVVRCAPGVLAVLVGAALVSGACTRGDEGPGNTTADVRRTVGAFMDARIDGSGAERFLTENARSSYEAAGLDLYRPGYTGYEIVSLEAVDATSFEVVVEITDVSPGETRSVREILPVGPGESVDGEMRELAIRAAMRE